MVLQRSKRGESFYHAVGCLKHLYYSQKITSQIQKLIKRVIFSLTLVINQFFLLGKWSKLKGIEILKGKYVPKTPEVEEVKKDDCNKYYYHYFPDFLIPFPHQITLCRNNHHKTLMETTTISINRTNKSLISPPNLSTITVKYPKSINIRNKKE